MLRECENPHFLRELETTASNPRVGDDPFPGSAHIFYKYAWRREVAKVLPNGIARVSYYDRQGRYLTDSWEQGPDAPHKYALMLINAGKVLFGDNHWQLGLSEALRVDRRRIREWAGAQKPVPPGVWADLAGMIAARKAELDEVAGDLAAIAGLAGAEKSGSDV